MSKVDYNEKTVAELRALCSKLGIVGMSKARKDNLVEEIEDYYASRNAKKTNKAAGAKGELVDINAELHSYVNSESSGSSDKYVTNISVSCGAASGNFPVVGKTIGQVSTFLKEVLNIDRLSVGVVNGDECEDNYVLKTGDSLEFLKAGGRKG